MEQEYKHMVCTRCLTYNHAPYIVDAMNGFAMQETTFPVVTLIVDDASTDGEQEVIKQYLNEHSEPMHQSVVLNEETDDYSFTYARHKTNHNCYFAVFFLKYNHYSIKKSKNLYFNGWSNDVKYIALCEGDDCWIDNNKLQKQFNILETHPECNICTHNALRVWSDGKKELFTRIPQNTIYDIHSVMLKRWFTPTASFFFRNNCKVPEIYERNGANGDMSMLYTNLLKGKLYYSSDVMSIYNYGTPGSLSSKTQVKALYQKKIGLFKAINVASNFRYSYITIPIISYFYIRKILA